MKVVVNKETGHKKWELSKWYEKTFYILGLFYAVLFAIYFAKGFVEGVVSTM